jgi:hypothetical protein
MRLRPGDRLRCSNPDCRLEVLVVETMGREEERRELLRCSCGSPMKKPYEKPAVGKLDLNHSSHARATRSSSP